MKTRIIALVGAALMCLAANADWRPLVEQGKTWKYYASVSSWDMSGVDKIYDFKLEGTTQIDGMDYAICNVYEAGTDIRLFGTPIGYLGETADHEVYLVTNPDFAKAAWANNDKVWRSLHTSALSEVKGDKRMLYSRTNPEKNLCLYGEYKADQLNAVSYASPSGAVLSGHGVNNSWFVEGIGYIEPQFNYMPAAFLLGEILYTGGLGSTSMMLLEVTDADGNQLYWSEDCMEAYKASSVEGVGVDAADAQSEYFNLKGVRIAEPEPGLYIRRHGDTTTKVIVK